MKVSLCYNPDCAGDRLVVRAYIKTQSPIEIPLKTWVFPGGECGVDLDFTVLDPEVTPSFEIFSLIHNSDALLKTLLVTNAIKEAWHGAEIVLHCPYMPYARQDRVCSPGQSFSLRVLADIINAQGYKHVVGLDPHSKKTEQLIKDYWADDFPAVLAMSLQQLDLIGPGKEKDFVLVCPDAGAILRTLEASAALSKKIVGVGNKKRDPKTGKILSYEVDFIQDIMERDVLVVDDICDGGRTFIKLGKELRKYSPESLSLYVSHGIFSQGMSVFEGIYDNVACGYYLGHYLPDSQPKS